jgi:hypothetical protein
MNLKLRFFGNADNLEPFLYICVSTVKRDGKLMEYKILGALPSSRQSSTILGKHQRNPTSMHVTARRKMIGAKYNLIGCNLCRFAIPAWRRMSKHCNPRSAATNWRSCNISASRKIQSRWMKRERVNTVSSKHGLRALQEIASAHTSMDMS